MSDNKLSIEQILGSDGFVSYDTNKIPSNVPTKKTIYEKLHEEGPIEALKRFGFFTDRQLKYCESLTYTGIYENQEINNIKCGTYLLSRTFVFNRDVEYQQVILETDTYVMDLPIYKITVHTNDNIVDESDYELYVRYRYGERIDSHKIETKNNLICQDLPEYLSRRGSIIDFYKNLVKGYNFIIPDWSCNSIIIQFKNENFNNVKIEILTFDAYCYGGFFSAGWPYTVG